MKRILGIIAAGVVIAVLGVYGAVRFAIWWLGL